MAATATGLDQRHTDGRVLAQASREHATGGAGPDDHIVRISHPRILSRRSGADCARPADHIDDVVLAAYPRSKVCQTLDLGYIRLARCGSSPLPWLLHRYSLASV